MKARNKPESVVRISLNWRELSRDALLVESHSLVENMLKPSAPNIDV